MEDELCPICGIGILHTETKTEIFEYEGHIIPVKNYTIQKCSKCGEEIVDTASLIRASLTLKLFKENLKRMGN